MLSSNWIHEFTSAYENWYLKNFVTQKFLLNLWKLTNQTQIPYAGNMLQQIPNS